MNLKKQSGATIVGILFIAALAGVGVVTAAKLAPVYIEFFSVKKVLNAMATSGDLKTMSLKELQASFDRRAGIDYITSVKPENISITRAGGSAVVSVEYSVKVPLVANLSAWMDFSASTSAKGE